MEYVGAAIIMLLGTALFCFGVYVGKRVAKHKYQGIIEELLIICGTLNAVNNEMFRLIQQQKKTESLLRSEIINEGIKKIGFGLVR